MGCNPSPTIKPNHIIEGAHTGGSAVALAEASDLGASGGWSGVIRIWELQTGKPKAAWRAHDGKVAGLYFVEGDGVIVSGGYDGRIVKWDFSGRMLMEVQTDSPVMHLAAKSPSRLLITGHKDGSVRRWDMPRLKPCGHHRSHSDRVLAVAFDAGSGLVASSDADGAVYLWHESKAPFLLARSGTDIHTLDFSPLGNLLYGGTWFDVYRWDIVNETETQLATEHQGIIKGLRVSRNGSELLTISRQTDSAVLSLDANTGKTLRNFGKHELCGSAVEISRDGSHLITTSDDASVRIWSLNP